MGNNKDVVSKKDLAQLLYERSYCIECLEDGPRSFYERTALENLLTAVEAELISRGLKPTEI